MVHCIKHLFAGTKEVSNEDERKGDTHPHAQQCHHRAKWHLYTPTTSVSVNTLAKYHIAPQNEIQ